MKSKYILLLFKRLKIALDLKPTFESNNDSICHAILKCIGVLMNSHPVSGDWDRTQRVLSSKANGNLQWSISNDLIRVKGALI
jgi:hypothetical protein